MHHAKAYKISVFQTSKGDKPVAILTGKSTKYGTGVQLITDKKFSGNNLIGMYCPEIIIIPRLYATTIDLTSPNQKAKHTIIK